MADDSTIENRVYLFKDLAAAWLAAHPSGLGAVDPAERARARAALAEIGRISCIVADGEDLSPDEIAAAIRTGGD
ncbi:MAG TPA: hypothetical protein RMH85_27835 [Polyangiaceae bacterium LLY-WYZ-15_(1-7)]|nr:hypothetical protein [Myxococcales bacterium]MAT29657.1 hypothetical protein [Sandaracinus sp.]HJK91192.1 hypothetical protein [Polyangiaceae bacterium LLY-WYZ-15_(1-7)]MBJ71410.1 hypothetical protein [Sandaracinus sp.]HJL06452.1 hypothetical protein [Polyangiaceae bacterium LLY-WYZ-15_(1-7)]